MNAADDARPDNTTVPVLLVRLRPDIGVGERRRVVHMVPVPSSEGALPDVLTAWCGFQIKPGEAQTLERFAGMPCERCLSRAPTPGGRHLRDSYAGRVP